MINFPRNVQVKLIEKQENNFLLGKFSELVIKIGHQKWNLKHVGLFIFARITINKQQQQQQKPFPAKCSKTET